MTRSAATTPNGLTAGDTITYMRRTCTITNIHWDGISVYLADQRGEFGYPVNSYECTPVALTEGQHVDRHAGTTTIRLQCVRPGYAYRVMTGQVCGVAGFREDADALVRGFATEAEAREFQTTLVSGLNAVEDITTAPAPDTTPASTPVIERQPVRKDRATNMSRTSATVIRELGCGGRITRGRGPGKLDVRQLVALHNRGYVTCYTDADGRITHATVLYAGVNRACQQPITQPCPPVRTTAANVLPLTGRHTHTTTATRRAA